MPSRILFLLSCFPILVLVHELGHFAIARLLHIRLAEFVVGFGQLLLAWHGRETAYRFHLLPFSAHVKPVSNSSDDPHLLQNQAPWRQTLFFAGGAIANLLLAIALLWISQGTLWTALSLLLQFIHLFGQQVFAFLLGTARPPGTLQALGTLEQVAFLSLVFGCINLVPVLPFDGAHILLVWGRRWKKLCS